MSGNADQDARPILYIDREEAVQIVRIEWQRAVKEFHLKPGSQVEAVVGRILNSLTGVLPESQK